MTSFMEELLAEVEEKEQLKKIELDRVKADQLLMALKTIDTQSDEIELVARDEISLIESWHNRELERLEKKRSWLCWNLEQFLKGTGEKTIRLAHGTIKERMGRDKVDIADIDVFSKVGAKYGLLRTYPEREEPDLNAVLAYIKRTGEIPPGVVLIPGVSKFGYTLIKKGDGNNGTER
jgi:phage host-nuclease inhibitor protein Gam